MFHKVTSFLWGEKAVPSTEGTSYPKPPAPEGASYPKPPENAVPASPPPQEMANTNKKSFKIFDNEYKSLLKYPFKSKISKLDPSLFIINPEYHHEPFVKDFKLKSCNYYSKPDFSLEPGCWEVDLMFVKYATKNGDKLVPHETIYLIMVNVNTRYLIVEPLKNKLADTIKDVYAKIILDKYDDFKFNTIKCDGENNLLKVLDIIPYRSPDKNKYAGTKNVLIDGNAVIVDKSKHSNAHKIVDATIRTLRNAFGLDNRRIGDPFLMQQMVHYYNNTPHRSLRMPNPNYRDDGTQYDPYLAREPKWIYYTPNQMQHNPDLEWRYIRDCQRRLRRVKNSMQMDGLLSYRKGNIILVHYDTSKTEKKHEKQRRVFNEIAEFIRYHNGNVECKLLKPYHRFQLNDDKQAGTAFYVPYTKTKTGRTPKSDDERATVTVPIMYTRFVATNYASLGKDYKQYFAI